MHDTKHFCLKVKSRQTVIGPKTKCHSVLVICVDSLVVVWDYWPSLPLLQHICVWTIDRVLITESRKGLKKYPYPFI